MSTVGLPRERKPQEGRVALTPAAVRSLVQRGHDVLMEAGAGVGSGFPDAAYREAGARTVDAAQDVWRHAEVVVKVKDPLQDEAALLQSGQRLFCYLHLAAAPELATALMNSGATAIAFETVEEGGGLPLLAPMSAIAGRLSVQVGVHLLHASTGGKGLLLGGVPGTPKGRVVVLGAGHAGRNAIEVAAAMGAEVTAFDLNPAALAQAAAIGSNVSTRYSYADTVAEAVAAADLVVGAVLVPGLKAPEVVSADTVGAMECGSVIVDIAVDQGGCIATTRPTTYDAPTYIERGVVHFAVANMPGAVPRTATEALAATVTPYLHRLLEPGWEADRALVAGVNVRAGELVHPAVRQALAR